MLSNGAVLPDFSEDPDPDELLSDEDAPDLQDEIAKTLTSLRVSTQSFHKNKCLEDHVAVKMKAVAYLVPAVLLLEWGKQKVI